MIFKVQFTIPLRQGGPVLFAHVEPRVKDEIKKKTVEEMIQIKGALYATHVDVQDFRVPHINI